ncbi:hypothetical protein J6590_022764 [Homalodisca vitripennis]|nr:hypothetical protein J6590_022764 [Homalodisca vitripennis]
MERCWPAIGDLAAASSPADNPETGAPCPADSPDCRMRESTPASLSAPGQQSI